METLMKLLQIRIKKLMAKIYNDQDNDDKDYSHKINNNKKIIIINNENKYEDDLDNEESETNHKSKNKKIYDINIVISKDNKKIKSIDYKYNDEDSIENDNLEIKSDTNGKVINKKTIKEKTTLYKYKNGDNSNEERTDKYYKKDSNHIYNTNKNNKDK